MPKVFLIAATMIAVASGGAAAATCNRPAYMVAVDTIDEGAADVPPSGIRDLMTVKGLPHTVVAGLPDRVYEKTTNWRDFITAKWNCADDIAAHWKANAKSVQIPNRAGRFFAVGIFDVAPPPSQTEVPADMVPPNCNAPILLLGLNTVTDPAQYAIYAKVSGDSKLAFRHGYHRVYSGEPQTLLAGKWPDATTATLSEWPCVEAFEKFYYSDRYQKEILPLRKGAARYRLVAFIPKGKP